MELSRRGANVAGRRKSEYQCSRRITTRTMASSGGIGPDAPGPDVRSKMEKAMRYKAAKNKGQSKPPTGVEEVREDGSEAGRESVSYEEVKDNESFESLAPEVQAALRKKKEVGVEIQTGSWVPESRRLEYGETEHEWDAAEELLNKGEELDREQIQQEASKVASFSDPRKQQSAVEETWSEGLAKQVEAKVEQAEREAQQAQSGPSEFQIPPSSGSVTEIDPQELAEQVARFDASEEGQASKGEEAVLSKIKEYRRERGIEMSEEEAHEVRELIDEGSALLDRGRFQMAERELRKAVERSPAKSQLGCEARLQLGVAVDSMSRAEEAAELYDEVLKYGRGKVSRQASNLLFGIATAAPFLGAEQFNYTVGTAAYKEIFETLPSRDRVYLPSSEERDKDARQALLTFFATFGVLFLLPASLLAALRYLFLPR